MLRRLEDQIRKLCNEIVAEVDDQQEVQKVVALRHALQRHIEQLRAGMMDYPLVVERRIAASNIPPPQNVQPSNEQELPAPESGSRKLAS